MNKKTKSLNIEHILFFDIETASRNKELDVNSREFELFQYKMRNRDTDELPEPNETIELYKRKAAMYQIYNRIVCISVGFVKDGKVRIKSITGEEEDIISQFCEISNSFQMVCGHNITAFDLPNILTAGSRYFDMSTILKDAFNIAGKKPWNLENSVLDTMEMFKGTNYLNSSLDEVCYHFNVASPKDRLIGSEVSEVYWNDPDGINKISTYCAKDVFAAINVFQAMRFEPQFESFEDKTEVVITFEGNELQRLLQTGTMDKKFKTWLKEKIAGLDKKEEKILMELVIAHYLIPKAKVAENKERTKEVKDLFTELKEK